MKYVKLFEDLNVLNGLEIGTYWVKFEGNMHMWDKYTMRLTEIEEPNPLNELAEYHFLSYDEETKKWGEEHLSMRDIKNHIINSDFRKADQYEIDRFLKAERIKQFDL